MSKILLEVFIYPEESTLEGLAEANKLTVQATERFKQSLKELQLDVEVDTSTGETNIIEVK